ncbi:hypothetical protein SAMD00079811_83180 (plasmid) [Scytonema sp. HK-05]|nr:hypothetical protein SAMD00079811_83180 [Scytonema sp. HK-05]
MRSVIQATYYRQANTIIFGGCQLAVNGLFISNKSIYFSQNLIFPYWSSNVKRED